MEYAPETNIAGAVTTSQIKEMAETLEILSRDRGINKEVVRLMTHTREALAVILAKCTTIVARQLGVNLGMLPGFNMLTKATEGQLQFDFETPLQLEEHEVEVVQEAAVLIEDALMLRLIGGDMDNPESLLILREKIVPNEAKQFEKQLKYSKEIQGVAEMNRLQALMWHRNKFPEVNTMQNTLNLINVLCAYHPMGINYAKALMKELLPEWSDNEITGLVISTAKREGWHYIKHASSKKYFTERFLEITRMKQPDEARNIILENMNYDPIVIQKRELRKIHARITDGAVVYYPKKQEYQKTLPKLHKLRQELIVLNEIRDDGREFQDILDKNQLKKLESRTRKIYGSLGKNKYNTGS